MNEGRRVVVLFGVPKVGLPPGFRQLMVALWAIDWKRRREGQKITVLVSLDQASELMRELQERGFDLISSREV